jgi:hypothetical protein
MPDQCSRARSLGSPRCPQPTGVEWTISFDSYDVADVTANYTYLTPQTP